MNESHVVTSGGGAGKLCCTIHVIKKQEFFLTLIQLLNTVYFYDIKVTDIRPI